jgi:DNA-binding IclR family transcriptional regulator
MVHSGYVERVGRGMYRLGARCRDLGRSRLMDERVLDAARAILPELAAQTGESVVLAALADGRRHAVMRAGGGGSVGVNVGFEDACGFFELVTGRVLAAFATEQELEFVVRTNGLPGAAWAGIESREALDAALAAIRSTGLAEAFTPDEQVYAVAAPVLDREGRMLAALGLHRPAFRATDESTRAVRSELAAAAKRLGTMAETTQIKGESR